MTVDPSPYAEGGIGRLPLLDAEGHLLAWTIVDVEQLDWASQWRWHRSGSGYAVRSDHRNVEAKVFLHRALFGLPNGAPRMRHINGDKLDNRLVNLGLSRAWAADALRWNPGLTRQLLGVGLRRSAA